MHPALTEIVLAVFILLVAGLIVWIIHVNISERDGTWHSYVGWFSVKRTMRRRVGGAWQYREMTAAEAENDALDQTPPDGGDSLLGHA